MGECQCHEGNKGQKVVIGGRTFPSSSIVSRPTSCPCLSPDTSSSPWSSSRKSSEEPRRARADGRAGAPGEGLEGSVSGSIMPASVGRRDAYHMFMMNGTRRVEQRSLSWHGITWALSGFHLSARKSVFDRRSGLRNNEKAMSLSVSYPPYSKGASSASPNSESISHKEETSYKPVQLSPQPRQNPQQP